MWLWLCLLVKGSLVEKLPSSGDLKMKSPVAESRVEKGRLLRFLSIRAGFSHAEAPLEQRICDTLHSTL